MNSRRMNRLEELGRVDAEKAYSKKGKRNLKDEKKRIVDELKEKRQSRKSKSGFADGGKVKKRFPIGPGPEKRKPTPKTGIPGEPGEQRRQKMRDRSKSKNRMYISVKKEKVMADGGKVGGLKKVQPDQKGLKKLPTKVRNKMGYMKKGGRVGMGKAMRGGGCVR